MKNNFFAIIFTLLIATSLYAEDYVFETKNIEIDKYQETISAGEGYVLNSSNKIKIKANNFLYSKIKDELIARGNGLLTIQEKQIEIKFDTIIIERKTDYIYITGNNLETTLNNKFFLKSEQIKYDKKLKIISSNKLTTIEDLDNNYYETKNFIFEIENNLIKLKDFKLEDNKNNTFEMPLAFINVDSGKLIGRDLNLNLDINSDEVANKNQPRFKGKTIVKDKDSTLINKGIFTTCRKRDGCPPWQLSAKKIYHDKKNQLIKYDDAILRLYNIPIIYFPKFFHPDPSVKRKSGFLIPTFNLSSISSYVVTPYFLAISESEDMTISPRFYTNQDFLLQNEYRKLNKNSNHILDLSIFNNQNKRYESHLFYKYQNNLEIKNFESSEIKLQIEQTSKENYLKSKNINSSIKEGKDNLKNSLNLRLISEENNITAEVTSYENLQEEDNDKFEFIYPKIDIVKKINNTSLKGDLTFISNNLSRNFETNKFERRNINNIKFKSKSFYTKYGLENNYNFLIKNSNINDINGDDNKKDLYLAGIFQFDSSLPLIKNEDEFTKLLKPKVSLKISPNKTKNITNENSERLNSLNLFNFQRLPSQRTLEGGASLAIGSEYSIYNKSEGKELFQFNIASNLRSKENYDLPTNHQLGQKNSNVFSEFVFSPYDFLTLNYNSSIKNNLKDISYENFDINLGNDKLITNLNYVNENESDLKNSFLNFDTTLKLDEYKSLKFNTRENKSLSFREYYNLIYEYNIDCLRASVSYNKSYYQDRDLKPEEKVLFKLSFIPLGASVAGSTSN